MKKLDKLTEEEWGEVKEAYTDICTSEGIEAIEYMASIVQYLTKRGYRFKSDDKIEIKLEVSQQFCPKCSPDTWANDKTRILPDIQICTSCGHEHKYNTAIEAIPEKLKLNIEENQKRERAAFYGYIDSILPLIPKHQRTEAEIQLGNLQGKLIGYMDFSGELIKKKKEKKH